MTLRPAGLMLLAVLIAVPAAAQTEADRELVPAEPDFTLLSLPTGLRMPKGALTFRLTHRFSRPIDSGSVADFFADFFGFDSSARVGLELRYGLLPGTQVTAYRTNDRTVQFLGQHQLLRQNDGQPFGTDALLAVEGANNFQQDFATTVGGIVSYRYREQMAFYAHPIGVFNAAFEDAVPEDETRHTFLLGLGARVRLGAWRTYAVAEYAPRLAGYGPGVDHVSIGIERRTGSHLFQFNVSNSLGTSMRQIARGGTVEDDWYVGFSLTRKFF